MQFALIACCCINALLMRNSPLDLGLRLFYFMKLDLLIIIVHSRGSFAQPYKVQARWPVFPLWPFTCKQVCERDASLMHKRALMLFAASVRRCLTLPHRVIAPPGFPHGVGISDHM